MPKHIVRWSTDQPLLLAIAAPQIASSAEACCQLLQKLKAGDRIQKLDFDTPLKSWMRLYKNSRRVSAFIRDTLKTFGELAETVDFFYEFNVQSKS